MPTNDTGRGYWARVDAGQTPYKPKLPNRQPQRGDDSALTVARSVDGYRGTVVLSQEAQETLQSAAPESVPAQIAALTIEAKTSILEALPAIKRTALRSKHPRLGADWTKAWKVTQDYTPKPRKGWYYGEPSAFEVGRPASDDSEDD